MLLSVSSHEHEAVLHPLVLGLAVDAMTEQAHDLLKRLRKFACVSAHPCQGY